MTQFTGRLSESPGRTVWLTSPKAKILPAACAMAINNALKILAAFVALARAAFRNISINSA